MTTITVHFAHERDTKGTFVYKETDEHGADAGAWAKIGSLYIKKTSLPRGDAPKKLKVTVEVI